MTTAAILFDIRTVAIGITRRAPDRGAHVLDAGAGLLANPHQEHGLDGGEVPDGFGVVSFGDALSVAAGKQVMTHDPATTFAVGGVGWVAIGVGALRPGGGKPGGVVGIFGEGRIPFVVGEGGVPCLAQVIYFVEGGGAGRTGARR